MTQPTQAQIEGGLELLLVAVRADDPKREILVRIGDLMRDIRALTAAAQVGEQYNPKFVAEILAADKAPPEATISSIIELVGEPDRDAQIETAFNDGYEEAAELYTNSTIERCAQVADKRAQAFGGDGKREIEWIAAEIRKLKDAP